MPERGNTGRGAPSAARPEAEPEQMTATSAAATSNGTRALDTRTHTVLGEKPPAPTRGPILRDVDRGSQLPRDRVLTAAREDGFLRRDLAG